MERDETSLSGVRWQAMAVPESASGEKRLEMTPICCIMSFASSFEVHLLHRLSLHTASSVESASMHL